MSDKNTAETLNTSVAVTLVDLPLRDWFAGMAMQGLLAATREDETVNYTIMAGSTYRCADAMLAARSKP